MAVLYLEIVSNDVDALTGLYQRVHGLAFGPPDPDLGQARVARSYVPVEDVEDAARQAEGAGATIACPPTRQGARGTFAIVIQGGAEHGLWQRPC